MRGPKQPPPVKIDLVAWSGDASQLACRLNMPEPLLTAHLKRLAQDWNGSRLLVEAISMNSGPIIAALVRLLNAEGAA